jgi:hypothetical protein
MVHGAQDKEVLKIEVSGIWTFTEVPTAACFYEYIPTYNV